MDSKDGGTATTSQIEGGQREVTTNDAGAMAKEKSIIESIKHNPRVIMYCILMTIGPMMFGFDNVMVGLCTALPSFQRTYGTLLGEMYVFPAKWLALWNAMVMVGLMLGSVISGPVSDRFSRRASFIGGGVIGCISTVIIFLSDQVNTLEGRRGTFLAGKILLGVALGLLMSTCLTYNSEITPTRIRGPLLAMFTFFTAIGQLIAVSIVFSKTSSLAPSAYRACFGSQWALAGFAIIVGIIIPESPAYHLKKNNVEQAAKSYKRLYGGGADAVSHGVQVLQDFLEEESRAHMASEPTTYRECFRGTNWRRTRIVLYANCIQQCLGITLVANASYFLQLGGMSPTDSVLIIQVGIAIGLPSNVISWFLMTLLGRRFIILLSTVSIGLIWLGVGIAGCYTHSTTALWFIGIAMVVVLFFFGIGVGGAYPVVTSETSSVRLRAKTSGLGFLMNGFSSWLFNFFVPYLFNTDQANLGGKTGFLFVGLCVIGFIVIWFEVPELKGRTYAEIDYMFEKRLPTRAFKNYVVPTESHLHGNVKQEA